MDSKGEMVPRPFGETVHGKRAGEVLHFDYLHVGRPLGQDGLDKSDGYVYLLIMMDDLSNCRRCGLVTRQPVSKTKR